MMLETIRRSHPRHLQQSMSLVVATPGEPRPMINVQLESSACVALHLLHEQRCVYPTLSGCKNVQSLQMLWCSRAATKAAAQSWQRMLL